MCLFTSAWSVCKCICLYKLAYKLCINLDKNLDLIWIKMLLNMLLCISAMPADRQ